MKIQVLVEIKSMSLDKTFTYNVPAGFQKFVEIGKRVKVPFSNRQLEGFIVSILDEEINYEIKDIISIIDDEVVLTSEMIELGKYIKDKTFSSLTSVYQAMLPVGLKASINNDLKIKYDIYYKIKSKSAVLTKQQNDFLDNFIDDLLLRSDASKISQSIPKTLLKKGVLEEVRIEVYRNPDSYFKNSQKVELSFKQNNVVDKIIDSKNKFTPFLLHGVTGSGKTEVYMNVIEKVLKDSKEIIVLVPEISLTPQIINKFKSRFEENIAILHSGLSDGEKYDEWRKITRKEVSIVIGARSAIFAPFKI